MSNNNFDDLYNKWYQEGREIFSSPTPNKAIPRDWCTKTSSLLNWFALMGDNKGIHLSPPISTVPLFPPGPVPPRSVPPGTVPLVPMGPIPKFSSLPVSTSSHQASIPITPKVPSQPVSVPVVPSQPVSVPVVPSQPVSVPVIHAPSVSAPEDYDTEPDCDYEPVQPGIEVIPPKLRGIPEVPKNMDIATKRKRKYTYKITKNK